MFLAREHPSDFPRILAAAARGQRTETCETMVGHDGIRFQVALNVVPARNGGGQVTGARAIVRDVSRERADEAQAWLTALLESFHDAIYALDARGVIRSWSPGAERLYGYAGHEAVGLPCPSLFPDDRHDEASMALECVLAGEPVALFDTEGRRKDGGLVPLALTFWPIWDRRGKVAGVSAIARDVTDETLVQQTLAESQARLRDTEALARVGHWVWDLATGVVQWSEGLYQMHGIDPVDFAGTFEAHLEVVHPTDRPRVRSEMRNAVATLRPFASRYRVLRPDATTRWIESRADVAPGPIPGMVAGLRGVCQDLGPVTHTEEEKSDER